MSFEVSFDRQSKTFEMDLDEEYRAGRTLYGKSNEVEVLVRFPDGHSQDLSSFKYKDSIQVRGLESNPYI